MTFTWQAGRQLASLQKGSTGISYTYSSDGTRLTKTVNGVKTSYTWDGAQLVSQTTTGGDTLYFIYHGNSRVAVEYKGNTYYYIYNLQGDVVGLVNSSGTSVVSYTYDAWGNPESTTGSMASTLGAANPFRYRSYYFDTESGLYYLMSRYYDPVVGRFLNADSAISTGQGPIGDNMFAYCLNNPVNMIDPGGVSPEAIRKIGSLGLLATICATVIGGPAAGTAVAMLACVAVSLAYTDGSSALQIPDVEVNIIPFPTPPQNNNDNKVEGPVPIVPPVPSPKPKPKNKDRIDPVAFYGASIENGEWDICTGPLTFDEAINWTKTAHLAGKFGAKDSWGIYTFYEVNAYRIALTMSGWEIPYGPDHHKTGEYSHYHPASRKLYGKYKHFHFWYGFPF